MTRVRAELAGLGERLGLALSTLGMVLPPLPQPFYDAYLAPLGARALIVATRAGLIAALADRTATPAELAAFTGLDERSTGLHRPAELCGLLDEAGFREVRVKRLLRLPANFLLLAKA